MGAKSLRLFMQFMCNGDINVYRKIRYWMTRDQYLKRFILTCFDEDVQKIRARYMYLFEKRLEELYQEGIIRKIPVLEESCTKNLRRKR